VFGRRVQKTRLQKVAHTFYPPGGWWRGASYIFHRLRRLPDPPHRIARGVAMGVFCSFTPFYGLHLVLAAALSFLIRGNILAALLATFVGNPITFPAIAALSVTLGHWMLGMPGTVHVQAVLAEMAHGIFEFWWNIVAVFTGAEMRWNRLEDVFDLIFLPYLIGGLAPGMVFGILSYMITHPLVAAYQKGRVRRVKKRAQKRRNTAERPVAARSARGEAE
jgi:uncharacterized protein (DUF2062 family)